MLYFRTIMSIFSAHTHRSISRIAVLIVLLAFGVRVVRLDHQSLWYDEGLSVHLAALSLDQTIAQSAVTDHPPLHAALLNVWMSLAGSSEFALRFVSLFFGTLAVALTYALARRIGGNRVGGLAAALIALAPMALWYAQEARGYSVLLVCVLIATLAFLRLIEGDRHRHVWLSYVLACAAAMYTHYFAAFAIVVFNVVYILLWLFVEPDRHSLRRLTQWSLAQLAIVVLFLPWIPNALMQAASNATYFPGHVEWQTVVSDTWRAFTTGSGAFSGGTFSELPPTTYLWLALIILGTLTPVLPHLDTSVKRIFLLVSLLMLPLLLMSILAWDRPKFAPRYLLPALPAFVTLTALGIDVLLRFRDRWLAAIILLPMLLIPAVDLLSIARIHFDPPGARPDVRSVTSYIEANEGPRDAILLLGGHQQPVFDYYYQGAADVIALPPGLLPAAQSPIDWQVISQLADIAATHSRAWLVLWQQEIADPTGIVADALRSQAQRLEVGQQFNQMSLLLFDLSRAHFAATPQHALDERFTEPLHLIGYDLDRTEYTSGQNIEFALYFESSDAVVHNYQVFTHLVGPGGQVEGQDDRIAGADSYPTSLWSPGSLFRNTFSIHLNGDLSPGDYQLLIGLYDGPNRLALADGRDAIEIATIQIVNP